MEWFGDVPVSSLTRESMTEFVTALKKLPANAQKKAALKGRSMRELVDHTMGATLARVDLHISRTGDGELLLTSRQDGTIRMLVPDSSPPGTAPGAR